MVQNGKFLPIFSNISAFSQTPQIHLTLALVPPFNAHHHALVLSTFGAGMLRAIPILSGHPSPSCTHVFDPDKIQEGRGS